MGDRQATILAKPRTIALSVGVDARTVATLALFWHQTGETPRSMSEVVRLSLEGLMNLLVQDGQADFVPTQEAAFDALDRLGLKIKKIHPRNLQLALCKEDGQYSLVERLLQAPKPGSKASAASAGGKISPDSPEFQAALAALEGASTHSIEERLREEATRTEEFKQSLGLPPNPEEKENQDD